VVARVVHLQATTRLCITKDLNEHDIVARIMRKENYLLGMINRDVLGLTLTGLPGARRTRWLTTCVRWNLEWAVFHGMFDDDFSIRPSFYDVRALRKRMRTLAVINLVLSPFIAIFMATYFALRDAERFYRHPAAVGARSWSPESRWKLREFNELKHFHEHRLTAAHKHATKYLSQFPSPVVSMIAKFVSYVVGAFAAMCIACALIDDDLLHAEVFGRDLLWHTAVLGTLLAASRGMIGEANKVFEPNRLMAEVVSHTHYLPRRWRDAAHKAEVQAEFEEMFPFKAATFAKEMLSIFVAPFVLWYPLCESAPEIVSFVRNFTVHRQGVGDVCSLSAFDFRRHGNAKYGAGTTARKPARSKQGKMEKSFLSFHAQYPTWEPDEGGREVIASLNGFKCSAAPVVPGRGGSLPGSPRRAAAAAARSRAKSPTAFAAPGSASMFLDDAIGASNFPRSLAASTATAAGEDDADAETEYQVTLQRFYDWNRATGWHPGTPPSRGDSPNELELGGGVDDRDARRGRSPTRSVDARRLETEMRAAVVVASRRPSDPDPCPDDLFAASPPTPSRMTDSGTLLGENLDAGDPLAALGSLPSPRGDVREPANPWDMDATAREWGRGGGV
jgi:autophagy-related protein 9